MSKTLNLKNKNINNLIMNYIQGTLNKKELLEQAKIEVLDYLKSQLNEKKIRIKEFKKKDPLYRMIKKDRVTETPELLKELRECLPTIALNKKGGFYNIVGGAGSGKTGFLIKIIKFLLRKNVINENEVSVFVVAEREEDAEVWKISFPKAHIINLALNNTNDSLYRKLSKEIIYELNRQSKIVIFDSITKGLKFINKNPLVEELSDGLASGGINMTALDYFTGIISILLRCTYDSCNGILVKNKLLLTTSLDSLSNKGSSLIREEVESISLGEIFLNKEIGIDLKKSYTRYNNLICNDGVLKNIEDIKNNYSNKSLNDFFNNEYNKIIS